MADGGSSQRRGTVTIGDTLSNQVGVTPDYTHGPSYFESISTADRLASMGNAETIKLIELNNNLGPPDILGMGNNPSVTDPCANSGGLPIVIATRYYKLRAWDYTCVGTPQSVTWIDTSISTAAAPSSPCGGVLSNLTVIASWT